MCVFNNQWQVINMLKNFTRGGQTTMHAIRMFGQVSKRIILLSFLLYLAIGGLFMQQKTTKYQWYLLMHYGQALLELSIQGNQAVHQVEEPTGKLISMEAKKFIKHRFLIQELNDLSRLIQNIFITSLKVSGVFIVGCIILLRYRGKLQSINQEIRGALFLEPKLLKKLLKQRKKCSDLTIGDVPLVKDSETRHILITGTTGSGKSVCMMELMDKIRHRAQRAIVYDDSGTFIKHYYREGRDVILNPLDKRCPAWNIWQDGDDLADFEAMAASLMPLHLSGSDPFWIHSARTIFSTLAHKLKVTGNPNTRAFLRPMFSSDDGLNKLLQGTVAEVLTSESLEKMALSIKSTLATYCKSFLYLQDETGPLFSIKKWIQHENRDGWIFVATSADKLEAIKPLISVWIDVAARNLLSLTPSFDRRIWFLIDELASLHRLSSLGLLLSQGRKYGVCNVTAFQDIHQLRSIYGRDEAEALLAMYNTNLCYRTKCPDTAMWMSRLTGQREIIEKREGFSYGANDIRDGVSVHQERRKEPLILDTQFLKLNDCEAYMLLPENTPVTKIILTAKTRTALAAPLLPNDALNISLEQPIKPLKAATSVSCNQEVMVPVPEVRTTSAVIPVLPELQF